MALVKLAEKRWIYIFCKSADAYVLSVLCGSVRLFELNIPLSDADRAKAVEDKVFLEQLVADIAANPA